MVDVGYWLVCGVGAFGIVIFWTFSAVSSEFMD